MFTRAVKEALTAYAHRGARPPEHVLETLRRLGYVDARGSLNASGYAKANELRATVEANRTERRSDGGSLGAPGPAPAPNRGAFRRG